MKVCPGACFQVSFWFGPPLQKNHRMLTKRLILVKRFFLHMLDSSWRGEGGGGGDHRTEGRGKITDLSCGLPPFGRVPGLGLRPPAMQPRRDRRAQCVISPGAAQSRLLWAWILFSVDLSVVHKTKREKSASCWKRLAIRVSRANRFCLRDKSSSRTITSSKK